MQREKTMDWFVEALKKYAVFSERSEYWYFFLFYGLISIVLGIADGLAGSYNRQAGMGVLSGIFSIGMLLPSLGVAVRRLHDVDRSGWWLLIALVPIVGAIVLLVFSVRDSQPGSNRFGANPKEGYPGDRFSLT
jgi:uncharacterized membrane protein YhaH (DUF805 family)